MNTPTRSSALDYPSFEGLSVARVGTPDQPVLARRGDDVRIDWGYGYLAVPAEAGADVAGENGGRLRRAFLAAVPFPRPAGRRRQPRCRSRVSRWRSPGTSARWGVIRFPAGRCWPTTMSWRSATSRATSRPYWRRNGATMEQLLATAARERDALDSQARGVRRRAGARSDRGRRPEVRGHRRAGVPADAGVHQARGRRQRPAAAVPEGELQQRLHRHGGRHLPDGAAVPAVRAVAGEGAWWSRTSTTRVRRAGSSRSRRTTSAPIRTPPARSTAAARRPRRTRCRSRKPATC